MLVNPLMTLNFATLAAAPSHLRSNPTLPKNRGGQELPLPPRGVTLKYIALGFGIQNYSCTTGQPVSTGALAMLYDITDLYPSHRNPKSLSMTNFERLTATVLENFEVPLHLVSTGGADSLEPFTKPVPLEFNGHSIPFLGHHFSNTNGIPIFDLGKQRLNATLITAVDAPANANPGPDETGAVPWLYIGDAGESIGISYVYRVLTAGGKSHGCTSSDSDEDSTPYAAQYWFYG
ncbi:Ff.00g065380.m01.CDS01 [Fusarium sp. VM40]|nr:Ff.00g065380.m01.CDS01 [Fusarium sp. VM40]